MSQEEQVVCAVEENRLTCVVGSALFEKLYGWSDSDVLAQQLGEIVGADNVSIDPEVLDQYSKDFSLTRPRTPSCVVWVQTGEQIQAVVNYARERYIPVVAHSSTVGFYGGAIPMQGGILMDLTRMKAIQKIDPADKRVMIEPGVTFAELVGPLAEQGVQVSNPLLPHKDKSVLTSAMEREPNLIPKPEYNETFLTSGLVLATGELMRTGSSLGVGMTSGIYPDGLFPGTQLYKGAQGTMGIAAWANIKAEWLPSKDKAFFIPFRDVSEIAPAAHAILRREIGRECLVLNNVSLATILADEWPTDFERLRKDLPPFTMILVLSGLNRRPEGRIAYQEEALLEVASTVGFKLEKTVAGIGALDRTILPMLRGPWTKSDTYWRHLQKGGSQEIFFYTTLRRVEEFTKAIAATADRLGYPATDLGVYVQPLEYGRACFVQFSIPCDPENAAEMETVNAFFLAASKEAVEMGGLFANPYGAWADMVYSKAATYTATLKVVKNAYDPNNILNPGKLCF